MLHIPQIFTRITRKNGDYANVMGNISCTDDLTGYELTFFDSATGFEKQAVITNNSYSIDLPSNMTYSVSLNGGENYAVENDSITINSTGHVTQNISVQKFEYCTVSGNIIGLSDEELASAEIKFTPTETRKYTPELVKDGSAYSVKLEKGVTYNIEASNVYNYDLATLQITSEVDMTKDIVFTAKSAYNVTIAPFGCSNEDLADAVFTFTNTDSLTKYTFSGSDNIRLVSGTYSVSVINSDIYIQQATDNVVIENADTEVKISFTTKWDFVNDSDWKTTVLGGVTDGNFKGLIFNMNTAQYHSKGSRMKGGTINIPTKGYLGTLTVGVTYSYDITMPDGTNYNESPATTDITEFNYYLTGTEPYLTINIGNDRISYISYITYNPTPQWDVTAPWCGSAFGSGVLGSSQNIQDNHKIIEQGTDTVRLVSTNNKGKITSSEDGLLMYFQEIDSDQDFTLTAKAHINSYDENSFQTGFGLMLRDDIIINQQCKINSPYTAVGNVTQGLGKIKVAVFRRLSDTTLESSAINSETINSDIELKLSRTNGVITAQFGDNAPITFNDSLCDLTKVCANKDYVGMFVTRNADITFNNIKLTLQDNTETTESTTEATTLEIDCIFNNSPKKINAYESNDRWEFVNDSGSAYAVSTNHTDNSNSTLSLTINKPCVLYYEMAVSSEGNADIYTVSKNGNTIIEMSGKASYTMSSPYTDYVVLNDGDVIEWKYSKDGSDSSGQDCAWLKNLRATELGDVNLDGKVDIKDVIMSQKYVDDISDINDKLSQGAADMNFNRIPEKADSAAILRKIIGNI